MTIRTVIAGTAHGHVTYALDELDARDDAELVGLIGAEAELSGTDVPTVLGSLGEHSMPHLSQR